MRSISDALPRFHPFNGLGRDPDAGGGTSEGRESGSDKSSGGDGGGDGGGGNDGGGNDRRERQEAAMAQAMNERGRVEMQKERDRAGEVAQRAFNQAVAMAELTPAWKVAEEEAKANVVPVTLPGQLLNLIATPVKTVATIASGRFAPLTNAVIGDYNAGDELNKALTQNKIDNYVNDYLDRGDIPHENPIKDRSDNNRGGDGITNPDRVANTVLRENPVIHASTGTPTTQTQTQVPVKSNEEGGISLPILGAGILALKMLIL